MRACALALGLALGACGGGAKQETVAPKLDPVDERKAEKEAKSLVGEIYQTIERSKNLSDGLMSLLAEPLVVFGPRKADAHATRSDALVALASVVDGLGKDRRPSLESGALAVYAAAGGNSAWAVDTLVVEGQSMSVACVLVNDDDFWLVVAAALARTPPMKDVRARLKKDAVVPPAMEAPARIGSGAEAAVERFKKGLAAPDVWAQDFAKRSDAVVIGASSGDVTRGKKEVAKLWQKRGKVNVRHAPAGEISAGATPDGQLAWVTAPVVRFADDDDPLPLRLFAVFEKAGSEWSMIALQESLALDQSGAGEAFKKIPAPAIKVEEPPPPPKAKPDPKKKQPKKKKKKSKKKSDDD